MWSGYGQIVAAGIAKKRWRQYIRDFEVVLCAPSLELRGESLGQTRVVIPGNGDVFFTSLPCWRHCSDMFGLILQGENFDTGLCGWIR